MTLNLVLLVSVTDGMVTVTDPVVPLTGTNAVRNLSLTTSKLAEPVPNFTFVAPARDCPSSCTFWPALPDSVINLTNGFRPTSRL